MGYYIEVERPTKKAQQLVDHHGAKFLLGPPAEIDPTGEVVTICVVQNGPFDAAAVVFSNGELGAFQYPDRGPQRPRSWLTMDRETVLKLCPHVAHALPPVHINH